ncbi:hypothetical protein Vretimale_15398, partial [Volvox reticuliferus]
MGKPVAKASGKELKAKQAAVKLEKKKVPEPSDSSDDDDSDDSDDSDEAPVPVKKGVAPAKPPAKKVEDSDDDSDDDDDSDSEDEPPKKAAALPAKPKAAASDDSDDDDDEDSDSDDDEPPAKKGKPAPAAKAPAPAAKKPAAKKESDSDDDDSEDDDDDSDEEPAPKKGKAAAAPAPAKKAPAKKESSDEEDSDDDDSDDDDDDDEDGDAKMTEAKKAAPAPAAKRKQDDDDEDDEDDSDEEDEEEEKEEEKEEPTPKPVAKKQRLDLAGNAAATNGHSGESARVFVGNLSWGATEDHLRSHFKDCGKIVNVRMGVDPTTGRSRGFAHVEFADAAQAQKAVSKAGTEIEGRAIKVEITQPRNQSFGSGGGGGGGGANAGDIDGTTIFVKGFDVNYGSEDDIRAALEETFGGCGTIKSIRMPSDREAGTLKGFAYIEFDSTEAKNAAGELDGSEAVGGYLKVDVNVIRRDNSGGGRGGRGGGRGGFGGRDGGRGFGGR